MAKQPVISSDIDGVIVDWYRPFLDFLNQHLGTNYRYQDITDHDLAVALGLPEEQMHELLPKFYSQYSLAQLNPIDQAIESLEQLAKTYQIILITSRRDVHKTATNQWFTRYLPEVEIYYARGAANPYGGQDRQSKLEIAEGLGAICLIEDNGAEFHNWPSQSVQPLCFAQPCNENLSVTHPTIPRLSWPEITRYLLARSGGLEPPTPSTAS
jgi:hypothetical protein